MTLDPHNYPTLTEDEIKARKKRNLILAWSIVAFMALVLAITMIKLKEGVARKQDWSATEKKVETEPKAEANSVTPEVKPEAGDE